MRMNHINLAVSNVPQSRAVFETYFGLRCLMAPSPETLVVLVDESDCVITLSNFNKATDVSYPNAFHIGFMQPSREVVDAIHSRLQDDGYAVGPCKEFHGAWTFYFKSPGGFTIEVLGPLGTLSEDSVWRVPLSQSGR
jgi:lactoylglutathione lyase